MVVELVVDRIVAGGAGIAEHDGRKVFVEGAAPGDRVRAALYNEKPRHAFARIEEILEPSPLRVEPQCPLFGDCGGCQFQHISHPGQLVVKKLIVGDAMRHIGRLVAIVHNTTGSGEPWHYRNNTQYPVKRNGGPRIGFFRQGSHDVVDAPKCLLHPPSFDEARDVLKNTLEGTTGSTDIHHLVLRQGTGTGNMLAIVKTRSENLDPRVVDALSRQKGVVGVARTASDNAGREGPCHTVTGQDHLEHQVLGLRFRVSPLSFFQVNTGQAEVLCRKVLRHLAPEGDEKVLDLFSGVGMLSVAVAGFVGEVTGIEMDPGAVADAKENARENGVANCRFIAGRVADALREVESCDAVILDPPRRGCEPATLGRISELKPRRVVYVSCDPATLARDLRILVDAGYDIDRVEPVDMFPQTFHVETVASLSRTA